MRVYPYAFSPAESAAADSGSAAAEAAGAESQSPEPRVCQDGGPSLAWRLFQVLLHMFLRRYLVSGPITSSTMWLVASRSARHEKPKYLLRTVQVSWSTTSPRSRCTSAPSKIGPGLLSTRRRNMARHGM